MTQLLDGILQDLRYAVRALRSNPGFTITALAMLGIGIGVNATVFTVTNAVLFKGFPLVVRNDRLLYISPNGCCPSYPAYLDYREQAKSFQDMAIVHGVPKMASDASGFLERVEGTEISSGTFKLVGQQPIAGRDFTESDEVPGATPVAILSYGFWERQYGKDPAIVGQTVRMNNIPTTVIGIMPVGFSFPQKVDLWVPLVQTAEVLKRENHDTWMAVGRLKDGVTIDSARAEMDIIGKRLAIAYPLTDRERLPIVQKFDEFFIGSNAVMIYGSMWGAVGFVLLIACANLANLLLARAMARSRETSVRIALGAGRWRIVRQLLLESVMLSTAGGFFGWWIAKGSLRAYEVAMARKASWLIVDYSMDTRVLVYLIALSIGTGILFGLAPAMRLSKLDVNSALKDGSRGATGAGRGRLSALLVTAEMALAVVLLAGAGVMIRSFLKIHLADMGVNTSNVLVASVELPSTKYPTAGEKIEFFDRLVARTAAMPGVESVALGDSLPSSSAAKRSYELAGAASGPAPRADRRATLSMLRIGAGYFHTMRAALLSGRDFTDADNASAPPVILVNQRFASKNWPGEDSLGKRLRVFKGNSPGSWMTVVGVVSNIVQNDANRQEFGPLIYVPFRQDPDIGPWVFARTRVAPETLASALRHEIQGLDSSLPIYGPFALAERLERFWDSKFYGMLFLIFAAIALLLASIGLYTVIAHSVNQRTQEIGIRMAIGATASDILRLVFHQGMVPLGIGLIAGLAASLAVNRLLTSMLIQVSPSDPATLTAASVVLIFSATLGCLIPAIRAMRVDPVVALRNE